jgi:WD40 repeat protein
MAPRDIVPGEDYAEQIIGAIESCPVLVLVLSESANRSPYVRNEVERAVAKRKVVIPFRIHNVQPSRSLEFFISNAQWIDAWQPPLAAKVELLVAAIRNHLAAPSEANPSASPPPQLSPLMSHVDWGEAPDVSGFHGREVELAQLRRWIVDERCRLVAVLGMGGLGKTALTTMLASQVEHEFAAVVWRSLRNALPVEELLAQCIQVVSNHQAHELPSGVEKRISLLVEYLRHQRCLLVLDNFETILHSERTGHCLPGFEDYGRLLQQVGEGRHQSCLVLTSREKPKELVTLEGETGPVRTLSLASLQPGDGRALLQGKGLSGSDEQWLTLHERYSGHPLALKVVAETIRELFDGQIEEFLHEEVLIFDNIRDLLAQQFARLSPLEQELMLWLAVEREPVGADDLRADMVQPALKLAMLEALRSLRQRSLVERTATGFTLQNVVLEYLTAYLIEEVSGEIASGQVMLLQRYALLKAQGKSYVQDSQRSLILAPIANRLVEQLSKQNTVERLTILLSDLRNARLGPGYAGGNLLNLLVYLNGHLRGLDFSQLAVWQAHLRGVEAQDINFQQADLSRCVFTDSFGGICAVAFSPDGKRLAAATTGYEVCVWRAADGEPLLTCQGHTSLVRSVHFSPDGTLLASSGDDDTVRLWDGHTGHCLAILHGHAHDVNSVCFSPDGSLLASGSADYTIRLWEIRTRCCLTTLTGHTNHIWSVCFSPEGDLLASASDDWTVRLWDVSSGHCITALEGHTHGISQVCFSPDGGLLASASHDRTVRLWEVQSGQALATLHGHTNHVNAVSFSPDGGLLASGGNDHIVRLWAVQSGQYLASLQGHTHYITSVCFNSDGNLLASGSWDQTVRLWEVQSGRCLTTLQGYTDEVWSVCFSPDGALLASASWDQTVRLWEVHSGHCLTTLEGHTNYVLSVSFSPDGNLLASGSLDQTVRLWEVHSGR